MTEHVKRLTKAYHWCKHNRAAVLGHVSILAAFLLGGLGFYTAEHIVGFIGTGAVLHYMLTEV